jgi:hypothetical protein
MARNNVAKQGKAGEQPVSSGIHRAAKRIGLEPAESPADVLDRTDEELDVLRHLAGVAEHVFEAEGCPSSPAQILRQALLCARSDFAVIGDACGEGSGTDDSMVYRRAELRIDLALALFDYRSEFGFPESANEVDVEVESAGVSS